MSLTLENEVRLLLRQVNTKPVTSEMIAMALEHAVDDLSNKVPFTIAVDKTHGVKNQHEYVLPADSLQIVAVYYMNAAGATIASAMTPTSPPTGGQLVIDQTTEDFPSSGLLKIDDEYIAYSAKENNKFKNIVRGANGSVAASHVAHATVIEALKDWVLLTPVNELELAQDVASWPPSDVGVPSKFYVYQGNVIGFDKRPDKNGRFNIMIRHFVRPPTISNDRVNGLTSSFMKAIVKYAAAEIAMTLASDDAAVMQARVWQNEYLGDIATFKQQRHLYVRGLDERLVPFTGRK